MAGFPKPWERREKLVRPGYGLLGSLALMLLGPPTAVSMAWSSDITSLWERVREGSIGIREGRRRIKRKREGNDTMPIIRETWWFLCDFWILYANGTVHTIILRFV